jgi:hypothetical protein
MDYGNCAIQSTNKIITAEENRRKLTINNPSGKIIRKIQVDGCLPIKSGKRCDYMFEIDNPISIDNPVSTINSVIYLELKGCDIEKAYEQLIATIQIFKAKHQNTKKECHIVASRVPKAGTKAQQLKVKMKKNTQAELIINTNQAFVTI